MVVRVVDNTLGMSSYHHRKVDIEDGDVHIDIAVEYMTVALHHTARIADMKIQIEWAEDDMEVDTGDVDDIVADEGGIAADVDGAAADVDGAAADVDEHIVAEAS